MQLAAPRLRVIGRGVRGDLQYEIALGRGRLCGGRRGGRRAAALEQRQRAGAVVGTRFRLGGGLGIGLGIGLGGRLGVRPGRLRRDRRRRRGAGGRHLRLGRHHGRRHRDHRRRRWDGSRGIRRRGGAGRLARALRGRHGRRDLRLAYLGLERRVAFRHLDGDIVRNRNRLGIEHHGQHDDGRQDQRDRACQPAPRTAAQLRRLHFAGHGRPFGGLRLVGRIFAFEKPMEENSLRRLSADGAAACRHLADEPNLAPIARALAYALRPRACKTEATVRNDPNTTILSFSAARSRAAEKAAAGSA